MWKPGESQPRKEDTNGNPPLKEQEGESPNQQRIRKLSGLTMNMKFMKRKADEPLHRRHSHDGVIARVPHEEKETLDLSSSSSEPYFVATAADMYCYNNLLGRRSFGHFNKFMEAAWTTCLQQSKHSSNRQLQAATDAELLQRYGGFGRRKAADHNIDDRPVKRNQKRSKKSL